MLPLLREALLTPSLYITGSSSEGSLVLVSTPAGVTTTMTYGPLFQRLSSHIVLHPLNISSHWLHSITRAHTSGLLEQDPPSKWIFDQKSQSDSVQGIRAL